jgi:hypothetical protein
VLQCRNDLFKKKLEKIIQFFFFFHPSTKELYKKQKIKKCMEAHTFLSVSGFPGVSGIRSRL